MPLYSYKMTVDSGFAPNPYGTMMTLATCKPRMRQARQIGDWIAGFTSRTLNGDPVGNERLIYLMQISEKLTMDDYFHDTRFLNKRPALASGPAQYSQLVGDNRYYLKNGKYAALPCVCHSSPGEIDYDLQCDKVLVAQDFYYFGSRALVIPSGCRPGTPRGPAPYGTKTTDQKRIDDFIKYVRQQGKLGRNGPPTHPIEPNTSCGCRPNQKKIKQKPHCPGCIPLDNSTE